jgi:S1-C subfamily serine protease
MDPGPNLLDAVLLLLFSYALVRGYRQGGLSQIATLGGGLLGLVAGAIFAPRAARLFVDGPGSSLALLTLGLLLVAVVAGQGAGLALGLRLRRAAERAGVAPVDRGLGMVIGAAGLVLVVWLLGAVLSQGPSQALAQQIRESRLVAFVDDRLPPAPDLFGRVAAYLDDQGFPQVLRGPGGGIAASEVPPTSDESVRLAAMAGQDGTVQVQATGCGGISSGTGFVTTPGFVVTNAHVVAGGSEVLARDPTGQYEAVVIHLDTELDLAVLASPGLPAPALPWAVEPVERGEEGATLGFPGGQREMVVRPATVRARGPAVGRDIYGRGVITRDVVELSAGVERGDSGGPFVTASGVVAGVVFAANAAAPDTGYALPAEVVRPDVDEAVARNSAVDTGPCRF